MRLIMNKKGICLLSGGLDSTVSLYYARNQGYDLKALTLNYGQLHSVEIKKAQKTAALLGLEHQILEVPMPWKGSSLLDESIAMPQGRTEFEENDIPSTYVPARNTVFLSYALSWAEACGAESVFIGANQIDYSGYPDCRKEYFDAVQEVYRLGTRIGVTGKPIRIEMPLISLNKEDIVHLGLKLNVPFENTWSCYKGGELPCGECDSCVLRKKGFNSAHCIDSLLDSSEKS